MREEIQWVNVCSFKAPMVALIDGTQVPSDSEAWRAECEARSVLRMPFDRRLPYLRGVEEKRGRESRDRLEADIWRLFEHYKHLEAEPENNFQLRA